MRRIRAFFSGPVSHKPGQPMVAPSQSTNRARLTKRPRKDRIIKRDRQRIFELFTNFLIRNVAGSVSESLRAFPSDLMLKSLNSGHAHTNIRAGDTLLIRHDPQIRPCRRGVVRAAYPKRGYGHTSARHTHQHRPQALKSRTHRPASYTNPLSA